MRSHLIIAYSDFLIFLSSRPMDVSVILVHIWKLNLSKSSIEDVLLIGSVLLDFICFIFQTASTILLRTHKKLFSSVRTKSIPQWGAKVPLSEVKFNRVNKFNPFPLWGPCSKAMPTSRCTEIQWDFLTPPPPSKHPGLLYVCVKVFRKSLKCSNVDNSDKKTTRRMPMESGSSCPKGLSPSHALRPPSSSHVRPAPSQPGWTSRRLSL